MRVVFVAYRNRSGSTFLANQLSRHPDICVCPEAEEPLSRLLAEPGAVTGVNSRIISTLLLDLERDAKLRTWGVAPGNLEIGPDDDRAYDAFLRLLDCYRRLTKPQARIVVVKGRFLIQAFRWATAVESRAPDLRIVFAMRDGRAVYASERTSRSSATGRPMQVSPVVAARAWCRFAREVEALRDDPRVRMVRYEDLMVDPESVLRGLYGWLELDPPPEEAEPDLAARIPPAQLHLHPRLSAPADATRIDAWRRSLSPVEVRLYEDEACPILRRFGYVPAAPHVSRISRGAWRLWFQIQRCHNGVVRRMRRLFRTAASSGMSHDGERSG